MISSRWIIIQINIPQKTGFHSVTNRGIVPAYIINRVKTWLKKTNMIFM